MKLLDSDIIGILLALATFIVPAISGLLDKKRKEKKNLAQEAEPEDNAYKLNEEIEELFNVLIEKETAQEEILPDSFHEPVQEQMPEPLHQVVEEQVELQTVQVEAKVEPEPERENSLKNRIKANPKEAVILSEILTPKFKEYN